MRACLLVLAIGIVTGCAPTTRSNTPFHPYPGSDLGGGGTEVGPGGDRLDASAGAAWFARIGELKVCVSAAPEFGYAGDVRKLVDKTFADWREYLRAKGLTFPLALTPRHVTCGENPDLRLELGTETAEIAEYRKYFTNPVAFPIRTGYASEKNGGWGRGFVWIARGGSVLPARAFPSWTDAKLGALLRHELGHVLGIGHVPGTIMSEDIAHYLDLPDERIAGVDVYNQLYRCDECASTIATSIGKVAEPDRDEARYARLRVACAILGRAPVDEVKVQIVRTARTRELFVSDSRGRMRLREQPLDAQTSVFPLAWPLFKIAALEGNHWITSRDLEVRQTYYRGDESWADEDKFHVTIRYLTHAFDPQTHSAIEISSDRQKDWLRTWLFEPVFTWFPLAQFPN